MRQDEEWYVQELLLLVAAVQQAGGSPDWNSISRTIRERNPARDPELFTPAKCESKCAYLKRCLSASPDVNTWAQLEQQLRQQRIAQLKERVQKYDEELKKYNAALARMKLGPVDPAEAKQILSEFASDENLAPTDVPAMIPSPPPQVEPEPERQPSPQPMEITQETETVTAVAAARPAAAVVPSPVVAAAASPAVAVPSPSVSARSPSTSAGPSKPTTPGTPLVAMRSPDQSPRTRTRTPSSTMPPPSPSLTAASGGHVLKHTLTPKSPMPAPHVSSPPSQTTATPSQSTPQPPVGTPATPATPVTYPQLSTPAIMPLPTPITPAPTATSPLVTPILAHAPAENTEATSSPRVRAPPSNVSAALSVARSAETSAHGTPHPQEEEVMKEEESGVDAMDEDSGPDVGDGADASEEEPPQSPPSSPSRSPPTRRNSGITPNPFKASLERIVTTLMKMPNARVFLHPVPKSVAPNYDDLIKKRMDLSIIHKRVKSGRASVHGIYRDCLLVAQNAMMYNQVGSDVWEAAREFKQKVVELFEPLLAEARAVEMESRTDRKSVV